jgi:hypothetical protein
MFACNEHFGTEELCCQHPRAIIAHITIAEGQGHSTLMLSLTQLEWNRVTVWFKWRYNPRIHFSEKTWLLFQNIFEIQKETSDCKDERESYRTNRYGQHFTLSWYSRALNHLNPSGYYMYHLLLHTKTLHSGHRVYLCVPYGSHNKQRLFP